MAVSRTCELSTLVWLDVEVLLPEGGFIPLQAG